MCVCLFCRSGRAGCFSIAHVESVLNSHRVFYCDRVSGEGFNVRTVNVKIP